MTLFCFRRHNSSPETGFICICGVVAGASVSERQGEGEGEGEGKRG